MAFGFHISNVSLASINLVIGRDYYGELIQINGSHHDWFSLMMPLGNSRFSETESALDYMVTTREYVELANKILQDRLVTEMRLQHIEQANV